MICRMLLTTLAAGILLTPASLAQDPDAGEDASQDAPAAPPGCRYDAAFSAFDFWLGGWNVYARDGSFAGQNFIDKRSNGCLLLEQWMSAGGGDGSSINFLDPNSGQWRQVWIGSNNMIDYSGGVNEAGQMVLEGDITYFNPQGRLQADFRGIWTPLETGHVIQHFQQFDAENEVWTDWFIATYVPISQDPNGDTPSRDATGPQIETPPEFEISALTED